MSRRKHRSRRSGPVYAAPAKRLPPQAGVLIAGAHNDITIPQYSGAMQHIDDTLIQQGGGKGLAIYDEIERDTHAFPMLQKRKKTLVARPWEIQPGGDRPIDQEAADLVKDFFKALPFDRHSEELLDATLKGYAVSEVVWAVSDGLIKPVRIKAHDPRRFVFDRDWKPRLLTMEAPAEGIALPERKFVVHRFGVKGNNPYGLGLGNRLFWPVLFKREGIAFWLHFLEKFAGPTVVGKTPYGTLSDEQRRLLATLQSARTSSAITVPIGTDVEFLEASRSGSVTYEQFLNYWDRQISICTTGETLTTQVSEAGGSRALGDVHHEMLELLVDSDADLLSETLRQQLATWIVEYNLPGAAVPHIWRTRPKNEKAEAETRTAKAGAAAAANKALREVVGQAARFEDDAIAREYIVSFELTDNLSHAAVDALVAIRHQFAAEHSDQAGEPDPFAAETAAAFAARLKKKR